YQRFTPVYAELVLLDADDEFLRGPQRRVEFRPRNVHPSGQGAQHLVQQDDARHDRVTREMARQRRVIGGDGAALFDHDDTDSRESTISRSAARVSLPFSLRGSAATKCSARGETPGATTSAPTRSAPSRR